MCDSDSSSSCIQTFLVILFLLYPGEERSDLDLNRLQIDLRSSLYTIRADCCPCIKKAEISWYFVFLKNYFVSSWAVLTPFKQQSFVAHSSCAALGSKEEVIRSCPSSVALSLMQVPGTCAPLQACSPPSHSAAGKSKDTDCDGASGIHCLHLTDGFRPQQGVTVF